jgi:hypothetical protein
MWWIYKGGKILSTPSLGGEVEPEAPCRKTLRHIKVTLEVSTKILCEAKSIISAPPPPIPPAYYPMTLLVGLPKSSCGRTMNYPLSITFHHASPLSHIWPAWSKIGPLVAAVQTRSLTTSTWSTDIVNFNYYDIGILILCSDCIGVF